MMLRIAQVAPLIESVPPKYYGGTERVVSYLTEALVRQGHDVTLFASGDSRTAARLVPVIDCALRLHPAGLDPLAYHAIQLDRSLGRRGFQRDGELRHFRLERTKLGLGALLGLLVLRIGLLRCVRDDLLELAVGICRASHLTQAACDHEPGVGAAGDVECIAEQGQRCGGIAVVV